MKFNLLDPIDMMRQLHFKYVKVSNINSNRYNKQERRTTRQIVNKIKSYIKAEH